MHHEKLSQSATSALVHREALSVHRSRKVVTNAPVAILLWCSTGAPKCLGELLLLSKPWPTFGGYEVLNGSFDLAGRRADGAPLERLTSRSVLDLSGCGAWIRDIVAGSSRIVVHRRCASVAHFWCTDDAPTSYFLELVCFWSLRSRRPYPEFSS